MRFAKSPARKSTTAWLLAEAAGVFGALSQVEGSTVPLADTIKGFQMICDGEVDHVPEQAFFNVGGMDMVMENWERLKKEES